jgi:hypothetical protein
MSNELKSIWRNRPWFTLRHHPGICLKGLWKPNTNLCLDDQCPRRESKRASLGYKSAALELPIEPTLSVLPRESAGQKFC